MNDNEYENAQAKEDIETEMTDTGHDPELDEVEEQVTNKIKTLRAKLKTSEEDRLKTLEELQRTKADFLNAKRRLEQERSEGIERAIESMLLSLLPTYDSFQMAMSDEKTWNTVSDSWRKGMEGVYNQLQNVFTSYNAHLINPLHATFDPEKHEAMKEEAVTDESRNNVVTQVIQPGLERTRSDDTVKVLRPARVVVGSITQAN